MLRTNLVRRAGRLLGAVTVAGVLSAGVLTSTPAVAQTPVDSQISAIQANGLQSAQGFDLLRCIQDFANGI